MSTSELLTRRYHMCADFASPASNPSLCTRLAMAIIIGPSVDHWSMTRTHISGLLDAPTSPHSAARDLTRCCRTCVCNQTIVCLRRSSAFDLCCRRIKAEVDRRAAQRLLAVSKTQVRTVAMMIGGHLTGMTRTLARRHHHRAVICFQHHHSIGVPSHPLFSDPFYRILFLSHRNTQGGMYTKIGQYLSTLTHVLPKEWTETLSELQDKAKFRCVLVLLLRTFARVLAGLSQCMSPSTNRAIKTLSTLSPAPRAGRGPTYPAFSRKNSGASQNGYSAR